MNLRQTTPCPVAAITATVLAENPIPGLPSASGVEIIGTTAHVISDDSPWLCLPHAATLAPTGRVPLPAGAGLGAGRLPKSDKPDPAPLYALL